MNNLIRVWDPLIRIFHWSLVLAFATAYLSGEEESNLHIYSGYTVLGLIIFRVVWGFAGSRYARFSSFVYSPKTVIEYLRDLAARKPKHYIGHNPAGGAMILVMLLCLVVISISGLKVYAIEEGLGPLASEATVLPVLSSAYADEDRHENSENRPDDDENAEEFWEEIHEISSNIMLFLVFLHITGVIISGRLHNESLIKAMITGNKISKPD